ncbi:MULTISPECIES: hypothetical protein [Arthrobacter]|uniref:Uncharacterized protein n=1 Tax=Arthrobacter terricola TaxID=2547396 RepID=A0A4R5KY07_9MICC|nr:MULTISPECIES: hypothetical protein [Arthrobacter]MBT8160302.1 hypothetical protein [Arthrobacter sp. GN70]TDF99997.1 hypothetical protein E1809_04845 [Arthrobacter terricola]
MSQEQPPIRSRRELRRARDARLEQPGASPETVDPETADLETVDPANAGAATPESTPRAGRPAGGSASANRVRRVADAPLDAEPAAERSSQARARDRAALRAIKELADKEQQLSRGGPPTRRQMRLRELQEEVAPGTAMIPVIGSPAPGQRTPGGPGAGVPVTSGPASQAPVSNTPGKANSKPRTGGGPIATSPDGTVRVTAGPPPGAPDMTVEQALMARELLAAQASNQANKLEHIAAMESAVQVDTGARQSGADADAADPQALAEQIAQAEREAILNKRAMAKQKLAEQNSRPAAPTKTDPSAASNLAMVTPLEFVKVPGMDRPVMKPPSTSFVPLVTSPGPKLKPGQSSGKPRTLRGRAGVLARAEAAAKAAVRRPASDIEAERGTAAEVSEHPPLSASSAHGLEPLDAATAGLGRAQRARLIVLGLVGVGVLALIVGIIMISSGLSR